MGGMRQPVQSYNPGSMGNNFGQQAPQYGRDQQQMQQAQMAAMGGQQQMGGSMANMLGAQSMGQPQGMPSPNRMGGKGGRSPQAPQYNAQQQAAMKQAEGLRAQQQKPRRMSGKGGRSTAPPQFQPPGAPPQAQQQRWNALPAQERGRYDQATQQRMNGTRTPPQMNAALMGMQQNMQRPSGANPMISMLRGGNNPYMRNRR